METKERCYIGAFTRAGALAAMLPLTLYNRLHTTASSCSKDIRWKEGIITY